MASSHYTLVPKPALEYCMLRLDFRPINDVYAGPPGGREVRALLLSK